MMRLYVADISPLMKNPELYATCYEISTIERKVKADTRKCHEDKVRCIGAGLLLQYAYGQFERKNCACVFDDVSPEIVTVPAERLVPELKFAVQQEMPARMPPEKEGANGKPCFERLGDKKQVYFNLSHSGNMAACIMADEEVGLDIQKKTKVRESVVGKCFLPEEAAVLQPDAGLLRGEEADRIFTRLWSRKEAAAKLTGRGLSQILEEVSGRENGKSVNALAALPDDASPMEGILVESVWIDGEYVLSYACYEKQVPHR